jgi:hypothetical protein
MAARHRRRTGADSGRLFASKPKGTARPDSGIDVLVEFHPQHVPGVIALATMERELSGLAGGRSRSAPRNASGFGVRVSVTKPIELVSVTTHSRSQRSARLRKAGAN